MIIFQNFPFFKKLLTKNWKLILKKYEKIYIFGLYFVVTWEG